MVDNLKLETSGQAATPFHFSQPEDLFDVSEDRGPLSYLAFAGADLPSLGKQVFEGQALSDVDIAWTASRAQEEAAEKVFAEFAPDCTV